VDFDKEYFEFLDFGRIIILTTMAFPISEKGLSHHYSHISLNGQTVH
jgi:hypothetical protein